MARFCMLIVIAALAMTAFPASAQQARGLRAADANADGSVTRAEFQNWRARLFTQSDTNKDGVLNRTEFTAAVRAQEPRAAQFASIAFGRTDTDKSGTISEAEMRAGPSPGFDRADTNKDGTLSAEELRRTG
jgi:hypothetical protein